MAAGEQMQVSPTFSNNVVTVGGQSWTVPYPVADVRAIGDRIVVIYEYMSGPKNSAFRNVEAFDCVGKRLWTAENPGTSAADAYVEFMSEVPLIIWNFACFRCTIDPATGKLLEAQFTK
jgi:hypothetical protein